MNELKTALKILKKLLDKGQIDKNQDIDLFIEFKNNEIREILYSFEEELEIKLVEAGETVYLVPLSTNDVFGFTNKDFREWISSSARLSDVFLQSYIAMIIFSMFYGGKNRDPKQRDFLKIIDLIKKIDEKFGLVLKNQQQTQEIEEKYSINFIKVAELWDSKLEYEENKLKTKTGTILSLCRLLQRENLINLIDDDKEIRPTRKLDDLMINYYLNEERIEEINFLISEGISQ
ncbi:MAG: DUF6063 family protein [Candidatus Muiribacteriota bacterium]|jgi:hypothetical protein